MLIDSLELSVGDHEVYVPRSVFADLSDVWSATLEQVAPGRFGLILVGGDSSAAYEAEIRFDSRRVTTRILTDREAGQVSEKTVYFDMSKAFH